MKIYHFFKLFLLLLLPTVAWGSSFSPKPVENSGEYFIREIYKRLPIELFQIYGQGGFSDQEHWIVNDLYLLSEYPIHLRFEEGNHPIFKLHPNEPARTAVTTTDRRSEIVFNKNIINNYKQFDHQDAMRLLIHELGHKVHPDIRTKIANYSFVIDQLASKITKDRTTSDWNQNFRLNGNPFELFAHGSFSEKKPTLYDDPGERYDEKIWPLIYVKSNKGIIDLSKFVFSHYLSVNKDKNNNQIYTALVIRDFLFDSLDNEKGILRLSVSYCSNKKDDLGRYGNRYLNRMEIGFDHKRDLQLDFRSKEFQPDYPIYVFENEVNVSIDEAKKEATLKVRFPYFGYGDIYKTSVVLNIEGEKVVVEAIDADRAQFSADFHFSKRYSGKKIEVLGFYISMQKEIGERDPDDDNYFPWNWYFVPVAEQVQFSF
jgi:hypothetical protein